MSENKTEVTIGALVLAVAVGFVLMLVKTRAFLHQQVVIRLAPLSVLPKVFLRVQMCALQVLKSAL